MKIPFTKMHGLGNDFIVFDCRDKAVGSALSVIDQISMRLCNRRFGIGADQVILLYDSEKADFKMRIFNADGSEVEMCGNGIRCLAKYVWDRDYAAGDMISFETLAGIIRPKKAGESITVDMGEPVLEGRHVPVKMEGIVKDFPLKILGREFRITCVSMGNPHAVIFVDDPSSIEIEKFGPAVETHELFPRRTNVEFVRKIDSANIQMRVWERGAGETMACGTGASAAAVAANLNGLTSKKVNVALPGGTLVIEWRADNHVNMTGPAVQVFEGTVPV